MLQRKFSTASIIDKETDLRNCHKQAAKNASYPLDTADQIVDLLSSRMEELAIESKEKGLLNDFIGQVEATVIEYLKLVMIDAELKRFRHSLIVAALFSAVFEIKLKDQLTLMKKGGKMLNMPQTINLRYLCQVWEQIQSEVFDSEGLK